jgi:hypothetical protein
MVLYDDDDDNDDPMKAFYRREDVLSMPLQPSLYPSFMTSVFP